jgi:hypothetical protein
MTDIREVVKVIKKINSKRSVSLEIVNNTDAALKFADAHNAHGRFSTDPPDFIQPHSKVSFGVVSKIGASGPAGRAGSSTTVSTTPVQCSSRLGGTIRSRARTAAAPALRENAQGASGQPLTAAPETTQRTDMTSISRRGGGTPAAA